MKFGLILREEAEKEMVAAKLWYEVNAPQQTQRLVISIEEAVERIRGNPKLFPKVFKEIRKTNLKIFPFKIFFRVDETNAVIIVYAFIHHKRSNKFVKTRTKE